MHAQVNPDNTVSIIDLEAAYPNGALEVVKPILEEQGYIFIELQKPELPGDRYDREKKEFWTYQPSKAEPTLEDRVEELSKKLDQASSILLMNSMATIDPPAKLPDPSDPMSNDKPPANISGMPDPSLLLDLMDKEPPEDLPLEPPK